MTRAATTRARPYTYPTGLPEGPQTQARVLSCLTKALFLWKCSRTYQQSKKLRMIKLEIGVSFLGIPTLLSLSPSANA
jgi:hypothetical protein